MEGFVKSTSCLLKLRTPPFPLAKEQGHIESGKDPAGCLYSAVPSMGRQAPRPSFLIPLVSEL